MKKILLLLLLTIHTTAFSQKETTNKDATYHRFGMNVATIGVGLGFNASGFPLSFYVANDLQQIVSFGLLWTRY